MGKHYYALVNKSGKRLSGFYPNALKRDWLKYRQNDWYSFPTREEAENMKAHINSYGVGEHLEVVEVV